MRAGVDITMADDVVTQLLQLPDFVVHASQRDVARRPDAERLLSLPLPAGALANQRLTNQQAAVHLRQRRSRQQR